MKVSELGEFGLIERLTAAGGAPPEDLVIGPGDDCAVWRAGNEYLLATTDSLVEGVHFLAGRAPWSDVGWKSLAVNVSDIAAMGGEPALALVTLQLPEDSDVAAIDELHVGLGECAAEYGVMIAGGDVVRGPRFSITVALLGRAQMRDGAPILMRRDSARPGEVVAVTGTLGDSAGGLRRLMEGAAPDDSLMRAHLRPRPWLAAAQEAARVGVRCAIDVSDGLLGDLAHVCRASNVCADIRAGDLPISEELSSAYPDEALSFACTGGEDYEVILVGTSGVIAAIGDLRPGLVTAIGRITDGPAGQVRLLDRTGAEIEVPGSSWDHLRDRGGPNR